MDKRQPLIVVFSGSGISAESGIKTFRDYNGLWENYRIEDVATPEAFKKNPELVLDFYNQRRLQLPTVQPNAGHTTCVELEKLGRVVVITQNVDDLHERAGSKDIIHLHGELNKAQNTLPPFEVLDVSNKAIHVGDLASNGGQLRPYIVWFGEEVHYLDKSLSYVTAADYLIIVGTSLQVWPAAGLVYEAKPECEIFLVDPSPNRVEVKTKIHTIEAPASVGMPLVYKSIAEMEGFSV